MVKLGCEVEIVKGNLFYLILVKLVLFVVFSNGRLFTVFVYLVQLG